MPSNRLRTILDSCRHFSSILIITLFLGYFFFGILDYPSTPWWKLISSDADNVYAASILTVLNGEKIILVHHPGATLHQIYGLIFKVFALTSPNYAALLQFFQASSPGEAIEILALATRLCRWLVFPTMILMAVTLHVIFHRLKINPWFSFLMVFYVMSSKVALWYLSAVRIEILNIIFFLLAYIVILKIDRDSVLNPGRVIRNTFWIGMFGGLSILTKIQTVPVILIGLPCLLLYLHIKLGNEKQRQCYARSYGAIALGLAIFNGVICPWWGFNRPEDINKAYISSSDPVAGLSMLYGNLRDSYVIYPAIFLSVLFVLSCIIFRISRRKKESKWLQFSGVISVINAMVLGMIASVYSIFLPVSNSMTQYVSNTHRLIYGGIMNNIMNTGHLRNKVWDSSIAAFFFDSLHYNNLYIIPFQSFLAVMVSIICFRIWRGTQEQKLSYMHSLIWIVMAIVLAVFSSMRVKQMFFLYYAIYPMTFFTIGIAIWLREELKIFQRNFGPRAKNSVCILITVVFALHMLTQYNSIMSFKVWYDKAEPKDSPVSEINKVGAYFPVMKKMLNE